LKWKPLPRPSVEEAVVDGSICLDDRVKRLGRAAGTGRVRTTWGGKVLFIRDGHGRPYEMHAPVTNALPRRCPCCAHTAPPEGAGRRRCQSPRRGACTPLVACAWSRRQGLARDGARRSPGPYSPHPQG
jgi:hypothetical protein